MGEWIRRRINGWANEWKDGLIDWRMDEEWASGQTKGRAMTEQWTDVTDGTMAIDERNRVLIPFEHH